MGNNAFHGPLPSARQLAWHRLEAYAFVHFTINTFTGREWGHGDESPQLFNPSEFDADDLVSAVREGGLNGLVLTAKHHDGFCLWPTATTRHSVAASPWRNGQGDLVREVSEACARVGLPFGIYLSPWDRNHAEYGRAGYVEVWHTQLHELLTSYGPVFEVWFDGANGGTGHYGGANERRSVDKAAYYDWPRAIAAVRQWQPLACIFSDMGPDIRWVGNEHGVAGLPCWATFDVDGVAPGVYNTAHQKQGDPHGASWLPAECDVSIRPGWFWHRWQNLVVKSPRRLLKLWLHSVGRGASLNLNVPPDRRGRVHERDRAALRGFKVLRDALMANRVSPGPDSPQDLGLVVLREDLSHGQRVRSWLLEIQSRGRWRVVARGQSIGASRMVRLKRKSVEGVRLRVLASDGQAHLAPLEIYSNREAP